MQNDELISAMLKKQVSLEKEASSQILNIFINLVSIASVGFCLFSALTFSVPPQLVPVDSSGRYFESAPLDQEVMSDKQLKQWYVDALQESFHFTYRDMADHPLALSHLFSQSGLRDFDKYLTTSKFAKKVKANYGIVELIQDDKVTLQSGSVNGRLAWQASTRAALMIYINGKPMRVGVYDVTAVILRENQNIAPKGVVINTITLKEVIK